MSHQSGITANDPLREKFVEMKNGHLRLVVILIENETLVTREEYNAEGTFDEDFEKLVTPSVKQNRPGFYFIRLDTISESSGHNWLLIVYIPDEAKVRERMLYASTVATLKREFGLTYITEEMRTSSINEMTINSYHQHIRSQAAPPPTTREEDEKSEIRKRETTADISVHSRQPTVHGLMFPFDENVVEALHLFKKQDVDYIQLEIDHEKELIRLSHSEATATPEQIEKFLPENAGRYHVYRFKHDFNNETIASTLFLYSVPGHGAKIKQRMVYASCKESVITAIEKQYGITFDRKLELCDSSDLKADHIIREIHPEAAATAAAATEEKKTFLKPKPPTRGPRRLLKTSDATPDE